MSGFRNSYRPERHYMRGPGPKWQAKHTASLVAAASAQRIVGPGERQKASRPASMTAWIAPTAAAAVLGFVAVMVLA